MTLHSQKKITSKIHSPHFYYDPEGGVVEYLSSDAMGNPLGQVSKRRVNAIKLSFFVGWVELRCTHQLVEIFNNGGFRSRSTHPTKNP
ncbi:hypothetical protein PN36_29235 [Candidatus Thiomargarita nelsonii]|uniref:Uncharacterized protein n=1 Tax=Candidatus Thiomargarita nelsonii TaxID=1003181 RepID=A0A4E0RNK8_9GAMM|nr:hypothetical protein PN36_29235 [Candidatus Thiomargarita nelsonii]